MIPPLDPERTPVRITVTSAVLVGVLLASISGAIAVGVYKTRIDQVEKGQEQNAQLLTNHDRQLVELRTINSEILRRLERIDGKLDDRQ